GDADDVLCVTETSVIVREGVARVGCTGGLADEPADDDDCLEDDCHSDLGAIRTLSIDTGDEVGKRSVPEYADSEETNWWQAYWLYDEHCLFTDFHLNVWLVEGRTVTPVGAGVPVVG